MGWEGGHEGRESKELEGGGRGLFQATVEIFARKD